MDEKNQEFTGEFVAEVKELRINEDENLVYVANPPRKKWNTDFWSEPLRSDLPKTWLEIIKQRREFSDNGATLAEILNSFEYAAAIEYLHILYPDEGVLKIHNTDYLNSPVPVIEWIDITKKEVVHLNNNESPMVFKHILNEKRAELKINVYMQEKYRPTEVMCMDCITRHLSFKEFQELLNSNKKVHLLNNLNIEIHYKA